MGFCNISDEQIEKELRLSKALLTTRRTAKDGAIEYQCQGPGCRKWKVIEDMSQVEDEGTGVKNFCRSCSGE